MLKHYVIVRRDLPLGVCTAMVLHAAAESKWEEARFEVENESFSVRHNIAVVLGVDSELELFRIHKALTDIDAKCVGITESGGPYDGQLMSVGIVPTEHIPIESVLSKLPLLKDLWVGGGNCESTNIMIEHPSLDNGWGV